MLFLFHMAYLEYSGNVQNPGEFSKRTSPVITSPGSSGKKWLWYHWVYRSMSTWRRNAPVPIPGVWTGYNAGSSARFSERWPHSRHEGSCHSVWRNTGPCTVISGIFVVSAIDRHFGKFPGRYSRNLPWLVLLDFSYRTSPERIRAFPITFFFRAYRFSMNVPEIKAMRPVRMLFMVFYHNYRLPTVITSILF